MNNRLSARSEAKNILMGVLLGIKEIAFPEKKVKPKWCKCTVCGGWHYSAK